MKKAQHFKRNVFAVYFAVKQIKSVLICKLNPIERLD